MNLQTLREKLENHKARSYWAAGVKEYAAEILDTLENVADYNNANGDTQEYNYTASKQNHLDALNGAKDWSEYSWGGFSLVSDCAIAETLCTPSELERTKDGQRRPNSREDWLDVQARALFQAESLLNDLATGRK